MKSPPSQSSQLHWLIEVCLVCSARLPVHAVPSLWQEPKPPSTQCWWCWIPWFHCLPANIWYLYEKSWHFLRILSTGWDFFFRCFLILKRSSPRIWGKQKIENTSWLHPRKSETIEDAQMNGSIWIWSLTSQIRCSLGFLLFQFLHWKKQPFLFHLVIGKNCSKSKSPELILSVHRRHNETDNSHTVKNTEFTNFTEKGKCLFLLLFCYNWLKHSISTNFWEGFSFLGQ